MEPTRVRSMGAPSEVPPGRGRRRSFDAPLRRSTRAARADRAVGVPAVGARRRRARDRPSGRSRRNDHVRVDDRRGPPRGHRRGVGGTEVVAALRVRRSRIHGRDARAGLLRRLRRARVDHRSERVRPPPPRNPGRLRAADLAHDRRARVRPLDQLGRRRVDPRARAGAAAAAQGDPHGSGCRAGGCGRRRRDRGLEPRRQTAGHQPRVTRRCRT